MHKFEILVRFIFISNQFEQIFNLGLVGNAFSEFYGFMVELNQLDRFIKNVIIYYRHPICLKLSSNILLFKLKQLYAMEIGSVINHDRAVSNFNYKFCY